jgi:hypothetical protein
MLIDELDLIEQCERAEAVAVRIDEGLGVAAFAAVVARPRGPARIVEARRWVQRARARGIDTLATLIVPGMTDDELDAMTELHVAIALEAA